MKLSKYHDNTCNTCSIIFYRNTREIQIEVQWSGGGGCAVWRYPIYNYSQSGKKLSVWQRQTQAWQRKETTRNRKKSTGMQYTLELEQYLLLNCTIKHPLLYVHVVSTIGQSTGCPVLCTCCLYYRAVYRIPWSVCRIPCCMYMLSLL